MTKLTELPPAPLAFAPPPNDLERRAAALASVQAMHDELNACHEEIGQLKADLNRAEDRVVLLCEERNKYRAEALVFRSRLIELATAMTNIGLLTVTAQNIMTTVNELTTNTATPSDTLMKALEAELKDITL